MKNLYLSERKLSHLLRGVISAVIPAKAGIQGKSPPGFKIAWIPAFAGMTSRSYPPKCRTVPRGTVLLEVVLSLSIFVFAAAVIHGGMASSIRAVQTLQARMRATNLAVTKISELQMGLLEAVSTAPESFDEEGDDNEKLKGWQWRIDASSAETISDSEPMTRVTVTIIQTRPNREYRLTTLLPMPGGDLP